MIFIIHYVLFSFGLPSVVSLLTLFLRTYAPATSLTEVGVLLMVLPFIATVVRPVSCALADRQQAHKQYLIAFVMLTGFGYGSLVIPTFFPDFISAHPRLVWYYYMCGIILGFSCFGVVFCIGDALALNAALVKGVSWGYYRAWATFSWGFSGWIVGLIIEVPYLPKYTPGIILLFSSLMLESFLVWIWPDKYFDMSSADKLALSQGEDNNVPKKSTNSCSPSFDMIDITKGTLTSQAQCLNNQTHDDITPATGIYNSSIAQGGTLGKGSTARMNPRMMAAIANMVVEEVGSNLKSSLRLSSDNSKKHRAGLAGLIGEEALANITPNNTDISLAPIGARTNSNIDGTLAGSGIQSSPLSKLDDSRAGSAKQSPSQASTNLSNNNIGFSLIQQQQQQNLQSQLQQVDDQVDFSGQKLHSKNVAQLPTTPVQASGQILNSVVANDQPSPALSSKTTATTTTNLAGTIGRAALRRAQLGLQRMNSLSSASGIVIADELMRSQRDGFGGEQQQQLSLSNSIDRHSQGQNGNSIATTPIGVAFSTNTSLSTNNNNNNNSNNNNTSTTTTTTISGTSSNSDHLHVTALREQQQVISTSSISRAGLARNVFASTGPSRSNVISNGDFGINSPTEIDIICEGKTQTPKANHQVAHVRGHDQTSICGVLGDASVLAGSNAKQQESTIDEKKMAEELQLVLLKIIIRKDPSILKYFAVFIIQGILLFIHLTYFFMHTEQICSKTGHDFSTVIGYYLLAHSISEIFCFLVIAPYYMPKVGKLGSVMTAATVFLIRYGYYGTYFSSHSPYWAIVTECAHGFAYGITYSLISDIARESVNQLDHYLPELIQLRIVDPRLNPTQLKLPLRATMQGIFSGAFDGLGQGIGVVAGGILIDNTSYVVLWRWCAYLALVLLLGFPILEWRSLPILRRFANHNNSTRGNISTSC